MEEADRETLQELYSVAEELKRTAASCQRGCKKTEQTLRKERGVVPVPELLQTKQWLLRQIHEYECAIKAAKMKDSSPPLQGEDLTKRVAELQEEVKQLSMDKAIKDQILKSLMHGHTLIKKLFPVTRGSPAGDQQPATDKWTMQMVESQTIFASDILRFHRSIQQMRDRLDDLRKQNLALKESNKQLMFNYTEAKNGAAPAENTDTAREIKSALDKAEVLRHIFNGLIIGSRINWVEDEDIKELLITLGHPVESQIT